MMLARFMHHAEIIISFPALNRITVKITLYHEI